jgi:hypothetical protein
MRSMVFKRKIGQAFVIMQGEKVIAVVELAATKRGSAQIRLFADDSIRADREEVHALRMGGLNIGGRMSKEDLEQTQHEIEVLTEKLEEFEQAWDDNAGFGEVGDDPSYNAMFWEREALRESLPGDPRCST